MSFLHMKMQIGIFYINTIAVKILSLELGHIILLSTIYLDISKLAYARNYHQTQ